MIKAELYSYKVLDGEILAGQYIKKAAERFLSDLKRKDIYLDIELLEEKVNPFFEEIIYVPELGKPVELPLPHAFWIQQMLGWKRKDTGLKRFRDGYFQFARKNAKTFYAAGYSLCEFLMGNDKNPRIMVGANDRDQAIICTEMVGNIMRSSPELRGLIDAGKVELFTYRKKTTEIVLETESRRSRIEAMPRDPGDGGNPSTGVVDEFHEANDTALLETIKSGQGQRLEPSTIVITSPGHNKGGPCFSILRENGIKVLEGVTTNDRMLPIIFELDSEDEWDKIEMMEKSNPMIPYIKSLKPYIEDRIDEAKLYGGSIAANIKIKNCGIWIDASSVWIPSDQIKANNHDIEDAELLGKTCYCGVDLATTTDLNAWAFFFPNVRPGINVFRVYFWMPEDKVMNQRFDGVDYLKWKNDGWIRTFSGNRMEHDEVTKQMIFEMDKYDVRSIGYDAKYFASGVAPNLKKTKYLDLCNAVTQGYSGLSGAVNTVEGWAVDNMMDLNRNPVLAWCYANTELKMGDQGDRIPSKRLSNGRIDGVSASLDAVSEYLRLNADKEPNRKKFMMI